MLGDIEARSSVLDTMTSKCVLDIQAEMLDRQVDLGVEVSGREPSWTYTLGIISKLVAFQAVRLHVSPRK